MLDEQEHGTIHADDLRHELQAGRISEVHQRVVMERLTSQGQPEVDFLDFLAYIPMFLQIHDCINDNPFDTTMDQ